MEIKVDISRLNNFLKLASVILSEKRVPEEMRFVKIDAYDTSVLTITILNAQCCMQRTWYDIVSSGSFECLVYASTFISLIKKLEGEVTLSFTNDNKLTITHATGRKEMTWGSTRTFPLVFEKSGGYLEFNSRNLSSILSKAENFVLNDDFSPVFRYVAIEIDEKDVSVVSSDKFQLYICKMDNKGYKEMFVTISQTVVGILSNMLKGLDCNIKIYLTEKITFVEIGDTVIYNINPTQKMYNWRYIDQRFQGDIKVVFDSKKVLSAIDRAYTPSSNESYIYITKTKCGIRESSLRGDETSIEYFEPDSVEGLTTNMVEFNKPIMDLKRSINCLDGKKFIMEIQLSNKFLKIYSPDNLNEYLYLSTYNN